MKISKNDKIFFLISIVIILILLLIFTYAEHNTQKNTNIQNKEEVYFAQIDGIAYTQNDFLNLVEIGSDEEVAEEVLYATSLYVNGDDKDFVLDVGILTHFKNLKSLRIDNCSLENLAAINELSFLETIQFYSNRTAECLHLESNTIKTFFMDNCQIEADSISLYALESLYLTNMQLNEDFINEFKLTESLQSLTVNNSKLENVGSLTPFRSISELSMLGAMVEDGDYTNLKIFRNLDTIYLDVDIDRSSLDFMVEHFKTGDINSVAYIVSERNTLELR